MLTPANSLAAAYLVIYILLLPSALYILLRHGRHGFLGWAYLFAFSILRITGAGLKLSSAASSSTQQTAAIINGVGLSPLVLAVLGVLHECCHWIRLFYSSSTVSGAETYDEQRGGEKAKKPFLLSIVSYVIVHLVVGLGLALVVVGASATPEPELGKERAGYVVFLLVWGVLVAFVVFAWRCRGRVGTRRDVSVFLCALTFSLPFLLIRIIYALAASFDSSINPETGPIAYRVVLEALMEFVIAIGLVGAGVVTKDVSRNARAAVSAAEGMGGVPMQSRGEPPPGYIVSGTV